MQIGMIGRGRICASMVTRFADSAVGADVELAATGRAAPTHDSSTDALIRRYRELREKRP